MDLFTIEFLNLKKVEIRKEWSHIDILILIEDGNSKLAIAIENKIKTTEHSNQLQRYRKVVENNFEGHEKLFIYLSPDGLRPSDDKWLIFEYGTIAGIIDALLKNKKNIMNSNIKEFISQYNINLRRHIVGDSEIERICRNIYQSHSKALDLIFQHKPDIQLEISEYIQGKIEESGFITERVGKTIIRFSTKDLDETIDQCGDGWSKSRRILMYEFSIYDEKVVLNLVIGPGELNYRNKLYEFTKNKQILFNKANRSKGAKWHTVFQCVLLGKKDFEEKTSEELKGIIDTKWVKMMDSIADIDKCFKQDWK